MPEVSLLDALAAHGYAIKAGYLVTSNRWADSWSQDDCSVYDELGTSTLLDSGTFNDVLVCLAPRQVGIEAGWHR